MKTKIGDAQMYYEISGNENGQWMVMLTGIKGTDKCSKSQMREFNKHYRVLSVDFSGTNSNSIAITSNRYSKIVAADLTRLLMNKLNVRNACFAGLSTDTELQQYFTEMFPSMISPKIDVTPVETTYYLQVA